MTTSNDILALNIAERLRLIPAKDLQALAEDMAVITCPHMFKDQALLRQGRSINAQTTKNWPDAYVQTGLNTAHGVEATRDQQSWSKHLAADLVKVKDADNLNLSGYFFVGGYPDHEPPEADIKAWSDKFIAEGIKAENVKLLVGKHLTLELVDPKYARIRQIHLNLPSSSEYFEEIRESITRKSMEALVAPSEDDLLKGVAFKPAIADSVVTALNHQAACEVRGHGACGKTTLAHWLSVAPGFQTTPIYRFDLAILDDGVPNGKIRNEMTYLSGKDALFIIDNVHLDEGTARVLADHWRRYSKPLGSRLLLLGRISEDRRYSFGAPILHMKAGAVEMRGIVKFLLTKAGCTVPEVPASALDDWTRTFGSTRDYSSAGLDLIAFSAAVEARTGQLARGNLKLSEKDATDAVQQHYLGPIKSDHTRANILRLAVLSDLESPVSVRALPFPSVGFSRECVDRGLVVARNGMYSLAHPALGRLLSAAAGTNVSEERLAAARSSSILTARMLRRGLFESERENLLRQLKHSLITGEWVDSCVQLHDISSILSVAARMNIIDSTISDQLISEDARIAELARGARSLETFISVAGHLRSRHFSKTANRILDITDPVSGPALLENLVQGGTGQVLALLKNFPSPKYICSAIELERWNRSREGLAIDLASSTAQMARFVEQVGYPALATAPARQFIFRAEKSQLFNSDLGDVSNIVRHARADEVLLCSFFERLIGSGWLSQAYRTTKQGQLCGALMSFANHLPPAVRQVIQLPEIQVRIAVEARQILSENPVTVARFTCLLGAASALWGSGFEATSWQWPVELAISTVFESRAPRSTDGEALGMYELQFWLGLRWLSENESALPRLTKHSLGESFLRRLEQSVSPSREAMVVRTELLRWLAERQAAGWQLIRA